MHLTITATTFEPGWYSSGLALAGMTASSATNCGSERRSFRWLARRHLGEHRAALRHGLHDLPATNTILGYSTWQGSPPRQQLPVPIITVAALSAGQHYSFVVCGRMVGDRRGAQREAAAAHTSC